MGCDECTQLYLTDAPRLVAVSTWSGRFKNEIFLTPDTKVNPIDSNTFDVIAVRGSQLLLALGLAATTHAVGAL